MIRKIKTIYKTNFKHDDIEHILKACPIMKAMEADKFCLSRSIDLDCDYVLKVNDIYFCKSEAVFNPDKSKELSAYLFGGKKWHMYNLI